MRALADVPTAHPRVAACLPPIGKRLSGHQIQAEPTSSECWGKARRHGSAIPTPLNAPPQLPRDSPGPWIKKF